MDVDENTSRLLARETIGSALAVLRRLQGVRLDADVRDEITHVRQKLSVTHALLRERATGGKEKKR